MCGLFVSGSAQCEWFVQYLVFCVLCVSDIFALVFVIHISLSLRAQCDTIAEVCMILGVLLITWRWTMKFHDVSTNGVCVCPKRLATCYTTLAIMWENSNNKNNNNSSNKRKQPNEFDSLRFLILYMFFLLLISFTHSFIFPNESHSLFITTQRRYRCAITRTIDLHTIRFSLWPANQFGSVCVCTKRFQFVYWLLRSIH